MKRLFVTAGVALATACVLASAQVRAAARPLDRDAALVVTSVTPTRNQECLPDLSDPGVNNVITVRFSTVPARRDILDEENVVNELSAKVDFHDEAPAPVPAVPSLRRNVLVLTPFVGNQVLAQGSYTLTLKPTIRSVGGRLLDEGVRGFTTTFWVGSRPPLLAGVSPRAGVDAVSPRRPIVFSFDKALDADSVTAAVRVEDRGVDPPAAVAVGVTLAGRGGTDLVVRPADGAGWAAHGRIAVIVAGLGTSTPESAPVLRAVSRGSYRGPGLGPAWTVDAVAPRLLGAQPGEFDAASGEFTRTFRVRGPAR